MQRGRCPEAGCSRGHARLLSFNSHVSRPRIGTSRGGPNSGSNLYLDPISSLARSRVDLEITIDDDEGTLDSAKTSTSGRHPSLSLTTSLDAAAHDECALLVILYNLERRRAQLIAARVLQLFETNAELAKACEAILPGLTVRLRQNPEGAYEALSSFEVLLNIVRVIDQEQAAGLEEEIRAMVALHAANVGSREKGAMRYLPETPMWHSIIWKAMNTILGWDVLKSLAEGSEEYDSSDSNKSTGGRAVLRLRCNSKTAGQGLPMTVSARIEVSSSDELRQELVQRLSSSYYGKSLAQISTSVWTSLRLSREDDIEGVLNLGVSDKEESEIQITSMEDLDAITMALAYLTADASDGRRNQRDKSRSIRDAWVPADARVRFSRSKGTPDESTYRVMVEDEACTIRGNDVIDGLIDTLDALRTIDPQFVATI